MAPAVATLLGTPRFFSFFVAPIPLPPRLRCRGAKPGTRSRDNGEGRDKDDGQIEEVNNLDARRLDQRSGSPTGPCRSRHAGEPALRQRLLARCGEPSLSSKSWQTTSTCAPGPLTPPLTPHPMSAILASDRVGAHLGYLPLLASINILSLPSPFSRFRVPTCRQMKRGTTSSSRTCLQGTADRGQWALLLVFRRSSLSAILDEY